MYIKYVYSNTHIKNTGDKNKKATGQYWHMCKYLNPDTVGCYVHPTGNRRDAT